MENMVIDDRLLFFGNLFISLSATQFLLKSTNGSRKKTPRTTSIVQIIFYFSPLRSEDIF